MTVMATEGGRRSSRGRLALLALLAPLAALALVMAGCTATATKRPPPRVLHLGALREMFASESAPGTAHVAPLLARPHAYALGPLAGLRGEILVWDGAAFVSRIGGGAVRVTVDPAASGPMLVWSHVKEWRDVALPEEVKSLADLDPWLEKTARELKLDEALPFAFLVLGATERATVHVMDLAEGAAVTHEAHDAAKHSIELGAAPIQALGFFAPAAADATGVWVHHASRLHVHLRTLLGHVVGHVDDWTLAPGATVKFAWR